MYLILKTNSWNELVKVWKSDNEEKALRFLKCKEKEEGIYGEHSYELIYLDEIDNVPDITEEEYESVMNNWQQKFEEHERRMEEYKKEMREEMDKQDAKLKNIFLNCTNLTSEDLANLFNEEQ